MFSNFIVLPFGEFNALLWPAFRILRCVACPEGSPSGQPTIIRSQGNRQLPEVTGTTLEFNNGRGSITRSDEKGQINKNNSTACDAGVNRGGGTHSKVLRLFNLQFCSPEINGRST
jgi:hypothetical protein